jgi:Tol biopolymer transport system component
VIAFSAAPAQASFPGTNGPIAFQRTVGPGQVEIFSINEDGTAEDNLTQNGDFNSEPTYSPDGSMIAFERGFEIWVMNADGSGQRPVTTDLGNGTPIDSDPAFSPDGSRIVYARDTNESGSPDEIFARDIDGSNPVNLTNNGIDLDIQPTFSPDGTRIAWARNEVGMAGADEVFAMDANGTNPVNLTNFNDGLSTTGPDYSPDGTTIAFAHDGDVWEMSADGSDQEDLMPGPMLGGTQPDYSPDGTRIAFARDLVGTSVVDEIFTLGQGPLTNVTNTAEGESEPSWGPIFTPPIATTPTDTTPPQTTLTKKPRKRSGRRRPRFAFIANEAATFECKLDKRRWAECASPRKLKKKLKPRRHRFRVRATDLAGNTDPTPARHRFRVLE